MNPIERYDQLEYMFWHKLSKWGWKQNFPDWFLDWFDVNFEPWHYDLTQRIKYIRCFFINHWIEYSQDPNGWDGEWEPNCRWCEGECPDPSWAYDTQYYDTLPVRITELWYHMRWFVYDRFQKVED
jgi:hypothetical protein